MDTNGGRNQEPRGRGSGMDLLRALAAGYLIYLGVTMIQDRLSGRSDMPLWLSWACGVIFVLAGVFVAWYTWKRYRGETAKKTDETAETASEEKEGGTS